MLITKPNTPEIGYGDTVYSPNDQGVFDVPFELGEALVRTHGFEEYSGEIAAPVDADLSAAVTIPADPAATPELLLAEPADGEEITEENAGAVISADGTEHVGEIPADESTTEPDPTAATSDVAADLATAGLKGNSSTQAWRDFAAAHGYPDAANATRNDIAAFYLGTKPAE